MSRLGSLISLIFTNLFFRGFCHKGTDEENKEDDDKKSNYEFKDGMGVGEGKGM